VAFSFFACFKLWSCRIVLEKFWVTNETEKWMTTNPGGYDLNKQCERSITKMSDIEALEHIGQLIDDAFDASFERGAKRALYLLDELSKRELVDTDGAQVEYFRANAWAALSYIANSPPLQMTRVRRAGHATKRSRLLLARCCPTRVAPLGPAGRGEKRLSRMLYSAFGRERLLRFVEPALP
jgi:hypothetical protein